MSAVHKAHYEHWTGWVSSLKDETRVSVFMISFSFDS